MATDLSGVTQSAGDPYLTDYYNQQAHKIDETYQIGLAQNNDAKQGADDTWAQKNQALDEQLQQEQNTMGDKSAGRGILNSGIYNYGSQQYNPQTSQEQGYAGLPGSQLGFSQQTLVDGATAKSNSNQNLVDTNQGYNDQAQELGNTDQTDLADLTNLATADASREAISNSIAGVQA